LKKKEPKEKSLKLPFPLIGKSSIFSKSNGDKGWGRISFYDLKEKGPKENH
jgi:hypothetical protein